MDQFNELGRRIPPLNMRLFSSKPKCYYAFEKPYIDYQAILDRAKQYGNVPLNYTVQEFKEKAGEILEMLSRDKSYRNILNGIHVPFACKSMDEIDDPGTQLQDVLLPKVDAAFVDSNPGCHFKAILQGDSQLKFKVTLDPYAQFSEFIKASRSEVVVGWLFPEALQEYDVDSQRLQMQTLKRPNNTNICLSGGLDICSALIGYPKLLINQSQYSPNLCLSAYVHHDPRLVCIIKSYGPHMEFWCMTNMLTKTIKQVSEQWSGGLTVYM